MKILTVLIACALLGSAAGLAAKPPEAFSYETPFRPQYHFSPQRGYMNDPNGLFYDQSKDGKGFGFYTSANLRDWTYQSRLPGYYVCPDLFELPVEGDPGTRKWVILDWDRNDCKYAIGSFDGRSFTTEIGPLKFVHGEGSHAATQTWKQAPPGDSRIIQMVNLWDSPYPGEAFKDHLFLDRSIFECYLNDGDAYAVAFLHNRLEDACVELFSDDGTMQLQGLTAWKMESARRLWPAFHIQ